MENGTLGSYVLVLLREPLIQQRERSLIRTRSRSFNRRYTSTTMGQSSHSCTPPQLFQNGHCLPRAQWIGLWQKKSLARWSTFGITTTLEKRFIFARKKPKLKKNCIYAIRCHPHILILLLVAIQQETWLNSHIKQEELVVTEDFGLHDLTLLFAQCNRMKDSLLKMNMVSTILNSLAIIDDCKTQFENLSFSRSP